MVVLRDMGQVETIHLGIVLISMHDRCMVCAKRTIGLDIILGTPDGTPM
jgi:hypothetical protein